jgi:hypothetical protein
MGPPPRQILSGIVPSTSCPEESNDGDEKEIFIISVGEK